MNSRFIIKSVLLAWFLILGIGLANAQKETYQWCFPGKAGLDLTLIHPLCKRVASPIRVVALQLPMLQE